MKYLHIKRLLTYILCSLAIFGSPLFFAAIKHTQKNIHLSGQVELHQK